MSESAAERTEQPTAKKLEDSFKSGKIPRSSEVQTVVVLMGGALALYFTGGRSWEHLLEVASYYMLNLHRIELSEISVPVHVHEVIKGLRVCVVPLMITVALSGVLAGGMQTRFRLTTEALGFKVERLNPVSGLKRVFSFRSAVPTALALLKFLVILAITVLVVRTLISDPIFYSSVNTARIAEFLAGSAYQLFWKVGLLLVFLAALDYAYQNWRTMRDLRMTKQEVKEELKNSEGNPQVKSQLKRRRISLSKQQMLLEVHKADVVVTNPTHFAVALQYDQKTMSAPRIVAKGTRLIAQRIKEIAKEKQIPIVENKPLARTLFRIGRIGEQVPTEFYGVVAEILAFVYRVNAYRYHRRNG